MRAPTRPGSPSRHRSPRSRRADSSRRERSCCSPPTRCAGTSRSRGSRRPRLLAAPAAAQRGEALAALREHRGELAAVEENPAAVAAAVELDAVEDVGLETALAARAEADHGDAPARLVLALRRALRLEQRGALRGADLERLELARVEPDPAAGRAVVDEDAALAPLLHRAAAPDAVHAGPREIGRSG